MTYQKPKGTVDFYPSELLVRNWLFQKIRDTAISYNFREIESPAIESFELLSKKENEEIKEQIFNIEKKGNERYGLRFDLTIPAVRMFIRIQKSIPKPVKWFYLSRMWRYEQPQQGRLREFYQFSAEIFGSDRIYADAEIISLAIDTLLNLALKKSDFIVKINNRKLLEGLLTEFVDKNKIINVIKIIDKKSKISSIEFNKELQNLDLSPKAIRKILEILSIKDINNLNVKNKLADVGMNEINSLLKALDDKSDLVKIDLSVARGLAYYTGTVFEIFDAEGKYRSLAGGGRYDNLVELLGGEKTPAVGFAIGYATLLLLLTDRAIVPNIELCPDYFIATIDEDVRVIGMRLADSLRKKKYSVEIDLTQRNLNNQLRYANAINSKKLIIVGKRELKEGNVVLRDMKSGEERLIRIEDIYGQD